MISSARVALAPLGPGVPARDVAVGVEHEDRVVLDRLDQQPEALLGPPQRLLRDALAGHVLHLQEEVERALHCVEHRRCRHLEPAPRPRRPARARPAPRSRRRAAAPARGRPRCPSRGRRRECRPGRRCRSPSRWVRCRFMRTIRPSSVSVAIPIAASSKISRKRSRWSASTGSSGGEGWSGPARLLRRGGAIGPRQCATSRSTSSSIGTDFSTNSVAPSLRVCSARPAASKPLNMTTRVVGRDVEHERQGGEAVPAGHRHVEQHERRGGAAGPARRRRTRRRPRRRRRDGPRAEAVS